MEEQDNLAVFPHVMLWPVALEAEVVILLLVLVLQVFLGRGLLEVQEVDQMHMEEVGADQHKLGLIIILAFVWAGKGAMAV